MPTRKSPAYRNDPSREKLDEWHTPQELRRRSDDAAQAIELFFPVARPLRPAARHRQGRRSPHSARKPSLNQMVSTTGVISQTKGK